MDELNGKVRRGGMLNECMNSSFFVRGYGIDWDMEYRYWSFVVARPACTALPVSAKNEGMDVFTWAWTGELVIAIVPGMS